MVKDLTLKSYEYLMIETFKRIEENKHYDINFKPYSQKLIKNILNFLEEREEYERLERIKHNDAKIRMNNEKASRLFLK